MMRVSWFYSVLHMNAVQQATAGIIEIFFYSPVTIILLQHSPLYRMIQDEIPIYWEVIVSVIARKKSSYEHVILNGYRDTAV